MSQFAEALKQELLQAIHDDTLLLPTLPEAALKVREAVESADTNIDMLCEVIGRDASLTTRILKVANSPLLRARDDITSLKSAVSRLGINFTGILAMGVALEQMFHSSSRLVDRKLREVWSKSAEVASISYVLARHFTPLIPDQAALAGLIHMVGALPIITYAERHPDLLTDPAGLDQVIMELHPTVGALLLHRWGFPESLALIPAQHLDFCRQVERADYTDVVQVAMLQSYIDTDHPFVALDWSQISSFDRLNLDPVVKRVGGDMAETLASAMTASA